MRAIFLDRDGTVSVGTPTYERVDSLDKAKLLPRTLAGLTRLAQMNFVFFFITNQAGISEGLISLEQFNAINNKIVELTNPSGIRIEQTFLCPHGEDDNCDCRKPKPKLLFDAAQQYDLDLSTSWMIGDRLSDIETGVNAGTRTILVQTGTVKEAAAASYVARDLLDAAQFIARDEARAGQ